MNVWVVGFVVALAATLSATQFVRVTALLLSAVDRPGGRRVHLRPTARLGGLGIFWGFASALLLVIYGNPSWKPILAGRELELLGLLGGSGLLLILGLIDDVRGLGPKIKVAVQVVAAILLWSAGWRVEQIGIPGLGSIAVGNLSLPLTVCWMVFVTNAFNLIDGLDGLACGVAMTIAIAVVCMPGADTGCVLLAVTALSGALLGFLWFNFNPALIFMGDSGSLFVGFVLSAVTLRAGSHMPGAFPLVPVLLLALPIADAAAAIVRRSTSAIRDVRAGGSLMRAAAARVFTADRGHLHHVLILAGFTTRRAVLMLWTASGSFTVAAWVVAAGGPWGFVLAAALGVMWGATFLGYSRSVASGLPALGPPASVIAAAGAATTATPDAGASDDVAA